MKRCIFLLLLFVLFFFPAFAQQRTSPKWYVGVSTGIDNITGFIGPLVEYHLVDNFSVYGAAGLGTWGRKASAGVRYYLDYPQGYAFNIGFSHAAGISAASFGVPEKFIEKRLGENAIPFKLLSARTVNVSALKHWVVGASKRNRFYVELGYAIPTATKRYRAPFTLTSSGERFMRFIEPGGIIVGLGFNFGL